MQLTIKGRNIEVTDRLRSYVDKKIGRLDRFLPEMAEAHVELSEEASQKTSQRQVAQVTVRSEGTLLRAEERSSDIYAAIDAVADKLDVDRRFKGKRRRKMERASRGVAAEEYELTDLVEQMEGTEEDEGVVKGRIVRVKRFQMIPMAVEEAIEQMELLGHISSCSSTLPRTQSTCCIAGPMATTAC